MLMTDAAIRAAVSEGELEIVNFDEGCLAPASYDMRLGEEAINSSRRERINPADKGLFTIPAGDFALVTTHERVKLSPRVAGHMGLRSHYTKKGLVMLAGPQIDPGFKGVLVMGLSNLSPRDVTIPYKERFCTVEFYRLPEPATKPYAGEYQNQAGITARDLENLVEAQGMTFGQVIRLLQDLSLNVQELGLSVKSLSESVNFLKWFFPVLVMVGFTIIGIVLALVR